MCGCGCQGPRAAVPLVWSSARQDYSNTTTVSVWFGLPESLHASPAAPPIRQPKQLSPTRTFAQSLLARTKKRVFTDRTTLPLFLVAVVAAAAGTLLVWWSCPTSRAPHPTSTQTATDCALCVLWLSHPTPRQASIMGYSCIATTKSPRDLFISRHAQATSFSRL